MTILGKLAELRDKFKSLFKHKKKILALENYSQVIPFHHKDYLILIKRCMSNGFLGDQEADFLNHMVEKYFLQYNFLDWTHKTKWLKSEMTRLNKENIKIRPRQIDMFDSSKFASMVALSQVNRGPFKEKSA